MPGSLNEPGSPRPTQRQKLVMIDLAATVVYSRT